MSRGGPRRRREPHLDPPGVAPGRRGRGGLLGGAGRRRTARHAGLDVGGRGRGLRHCCGASHAALPGPALRAVSGTWPGFRRSPVTAAGCARPEGGARWPGCCIPVPTRRARENQLVLWDRGLTVSAELLALTEELEAARGVDVRTMRDLERLLGDGAVSPLLNERIPTSELACAIRSLRLPPRHRRPAFAERRLPPAEDRYQYRWCASGVSALLDAPCPVSTQQETTVRMSAPRAGSGQPGTEAVGSPARPSGGGCSSATARRAP